MKLLVVIIQDEDASRLIDCLMDDGFSITKLATTGGFLRSGNTTLLAGVDDQRVDDALKDIEKVCSTRKQIVPADPSLMGVPGAFTALPIEVSVGGATVFILPVEQFVKL